MKKAISVLLCLCLVLSVFTVVPFAASAAEVTEESVGASSGTTGDSCRWSLDDEGNLTISGNGAMENYSFKYFNDTYITTAPWGADIKTVIIEDGVTNIGEYAFSGCTGLKSVTIPDSVTSIGYEAFCNCKSLTSVTIPDSVTSIGYEAFCNCTGLTSITIPNNVTTIDYSAFYGCSGLTSVQIGTSVTSIGGSAFEDCTGLTSVTIPDSVTCIGEHAFYGCHVLTSVKIPDSVTSIGYNAFYDTAWYNNQPNGLIYAGKVAYKYKGTMPNNASITLQEGTKGITASAFYRYNNLRSITIPNSVTSIGMEAFRGCTGLTNVTIGNSVTSIGVDAFYNCTGLTSVHITDIAAWCNIAFSNLDSNPLYYAHNLFLNDVPVTDLIIPDSVTSIGDYAFSDCDGLTSVTIPDNVTSIGDDAFRYCTRLTSVYISDIAAWCNIAFSNSYSNPLLYAHNLYLNDVPVTDLIIPDSVTSIGSYAFEYCSGLTSVTIPDSVTEVGAYAFAHGSADLIIYGNIGTAAEDYCKSDGVRFRAIYEYTLLSDDTIRVTKCNLIERQLVIPSTIGGKSVSQIGDWMFLNNSSITSVTLPDSLTRIGKGAFNSCVELKTVTMGNNVTEIGESAFEKCLFLEQINLSSKLKTIGDEAFYDCRRLKQLNLPNTLTTIGEEAFTNCRSLTELVIPKGVQNLGNEESVGFGMFENCKNLKEITIPESVGYIQDNAFDGCGQVTIRAKVNSYAAQYAAANQLAFSKIDSEPVGDANGDSKINVRDVTSIQRFVGEFVQFTDEQLAAADVDGNGIVDINDATYLQMYLAEYDVTLG